MKNLLLTNASSKITNLFKNADEAFFEALIVLLSLLSPICLHLHAADHSVKLVFKSYGCLPSERAQLERIEIHMQDRRIAEF